MPISADELDQLDVVRAIFKPTRTDNLKPGVAEHIGREGLFLVNGYCSEDSAYPDDLLMIVPREWSGPHEWFWFPHSDLEIIERVPMNHEEWYGLYRDNTIKASN